MDKQIIQKGIQSSNIDQLKLLIRSSPKEKYFAYFVGPHTT